jgi:hypothetical protein
MALITCSACGREISDKARPCSGCGAPSLAPPNPPAPAKPRPPLTRGDVIFRRIIAGLFIGVGAAWNYYTDHEQGTILILIGWGILHKSFRRPAPLWESACYAVGIMMAWFLILSAIPVA